MPDDDLRFITTYGGVEGACTLTQARQYSAKFTAGPCKAAASQAAAVIVQQAAAAAAKAVEAKLTQQPQSACTSGPAVGLAVGQPSCAGSAVSLSAQQAYATSCAVAQALTTSAADSWLSRARCGSDASCVTCDLMLPVSSAGGEDGCATPTMPVGGFSTPPADLTETQHVLDSRHSCSSAELQDGSDLPTAALGTDAAVASGEGAGPHVQSASRVVSKAAAAALQTLVSYLDKAHGLRVVGLTAEVGSLFRRMPGASGTHTSSSHHMLMTSTDQSYCI